MITRWRIEAEASTREGIEDDMEYGMALVGIDLSQGEWTITDNQFIPVERNGEALIYGRRVFRRTNG